MREFKKIGDCIGDKIEDKSRIYVYTSRDIFLKLKRIAIDNDTSVSEMLRAMIDDFLANHSDSSESMAG
jgi:hypothetical protein